MHLCDVQCICACVNPVHVSMQHPGQSVSGAFDGWKVSSVALAAECMSLSNIVSLFSEFSSLVLFHCCVL